MAEPVVELIAANIAAAINEITTGNGFNYTLSCHRAKHFDFLNKSWKDLDVIVKQLERTKASDENMISRWEQSVVIAAILLQPESSSTPIDIKNNRVAADIEKKLMTDPYRGGNADDTGVDSVVPFKIATGQTGIWMEITVYFGTVENNPYTKA